MSNPLTVLFKVFELKATPSPAIVCDASTVCLFELLLLLPIDKLVGWENSITQSCKEMKATPFLLITISSGPMMSIS
jgi:hypothetical protein